MLPLADRAAQQKAVPRGGAQAAHHSSDFVTSKVSPKSLNFWLEMVLMGEV